MRAFIPPIQHLQLPKIWLLPIAGCLIALHFHQTWKAGLTNLVVTSILFFAAIFLRLSKRTNTLNLESTVFSRMLGICAIALLLYNSIPIPNEHFPIRLFPFISALGIALLASGIKGLKQYWQELMLLLVLGVPLEALIQPINEIFGVTTLLAKFSTFILWYLGFDVSRQGEFIILQTKATWVGPNCSGILTMLWMVQLGLLFLVMFPTKLLHKILVPVAAILIVVIVNGIRIAIMSLLAAHDYQMFEYWHSDKAQIFSTIPLLLFAGFCKFLIKQKFQENKLTQ